MLQADMQKDNLTAESIVTSQVAIIRLTTGLLQGLILYFLYRAGVEEFWPATQDYLFAPIWLVCVLTPPILISSLGHLRAKQIAIWMFAVVILISLLAVYDVWRGETGFSAAADVAGKVLPRYPSPLLIGCVAVGFYIAHSLVLAGVLDGRRIAKYSSYFEVAWKLLVQMKFSLLFVGALWLVLWLGAALFMLVKLNFLKDLLGESWFAIPVTAFAFACAIHITDVRPAIVRGIRTLLLVLLSWILPISTLLVTGFLLSLPWTGLAPLWATRHATAVLLGSAAVLIVLINAAFQNGEMAANVARVVRVSARIAALSLLPLVVIATYSLGLRVGEYGWTTDRIIVAACLLVAGCYALGYAWAACKRSGWLEPVANVNVVTAFVVLAVLLVLFLPVGDPARLSVNDQMARFAAGKVKADKFDFDYLRFDGARFGRAALEQLKNSQGADAVLIRKNVELALQKKYKWSTSEPKPFDLAANLGVWPKSGHLPESFLKNRWSEHRNAWELPACLRQAGYQCDAYLIDTDGDGKTGVLLVGVERHIGATFLVEGEDHRWTSVADLPNDLAGCEPMRKKLQEGNFKLVAPRVRDIEIAGQRMHLQNADQTRSMICKDQKK